MSLHTVTGRILNVTTRQLGTSLTAAAAAGDTTLYVDDCGDFEDDGSGGWISINDQVIQFDTVDDDASTIHLLAGLSAAADEGDPVYSWSTLYGQIDDEQAALVQVDGDTDLADPVHADVADSVGILPEGLRGAAGETCTLTHLSPGVWEITAVLGQPSSAKGASAVNFDQATRTATAAGTQVITLPHVPVLNSEHLYWRPSGQGGLYLSGSYWTRSDRKITVTDPGCFAAGDKLTVEYAYLQDIARANNFNTFYDVPITLPSGASPGDAVILGVIFNTGGSYQLNGFTLLGATTPINHPVSNGATLANTTQLLVMAGTLDDSLTVPTFTADSTNLDCPYVIATFPRGGDVGTAQVASSADASSGATPAVSGGKVVRIWATMGDNPEIDTPSTVTTVTGSNPKRDPSAHNDLQIVMTLDSDDGGARTATCPVSCGWMLAAIQTGVNL